MSATKDMRHKTTADGRATVPIEHLKTNAEDLAEAQRRKDESKRRPRPSQSPGGPGTFRPINNAEFE